MFDSYNDGWNGATWTATNDDTGEIVGPFGEDFTNGGAATQGFDASDGNYTVVCGGGEYDSEVS